MDVQEYFKKLNAESQTVFPEFRPLVKNWIKMDKKAINLGSKKHRSCVVLIF